MEPFQDLKIGGGGDNETKYMGVISGYLPSTSWPTLHVQ